MITFETILAQEFSTLRITGPEEDKVTTLVACASLHRGHAAQCPSIHKPKQEKGRSWSSTHEKGLYLEGTDQGTHDPTRGFRFLDSMFSSGRAEDVLSRWDRVLDRSLLIDAAKGSLYIYKCSDALLKVFCESWCPSTNTLIIHQVELSVSLWDSLRLGGLPVTGRLFEEVVPTAECLSLDLGRRNLIPRSCRFLLLAYHHLDSHSSDGTVSVSSWVNFWNRSLRTYVGHEVADQSTTKIPPASVCPRGSFIPQHRPWVSHDRYPFEILEVGDDLEEEVYCVAFLSCSLCVFVLPTEPLGLIRASVFKMASIMAKGSNLGLSLPVLTCIYESLSLISLSDDPSAAHE
ncbi:hypothetical protein LIER_09569 [Lithospermum erythrorhizon]|uniref:Aminotransferase-like plant mobile domain-containing protein n=1 Tax=Lithospermum erythrorhizon TaxID=34254 RepID=A0AAV3PL20_LITER